MAHVKSMFQTAVHISRFQQAQSVLQPSPACARLLRAALVLEEAWHASRRDAGAARAAMPHWAVVAAAAALLTNGRLGTLPQTRKLP